MSPSDFRFETIQNPTAEQIKMLGDGLTEHASPFVPGKGFQPVGIFAYDSTGNVAAGGSGLVNWNWLHIQLLWVRPNLRGKGLGSRLLAEMEELGRQAGCSLVHLDTFSWQGETYYPRFGYEIFGELADYPPGQRRLFFRKKLSDHN